jgi:hypothetical protein
MELISSNASIGYFGVPGGFGGLTHLSDGKTALCGTRFHPEAVYQWCLPDWRMGDAECNRCSKMRTKWLLKNNLPLIDPRPVPRRITPVRLSLLERVKNYLEVGGLFNPEMMDHDKVRTLIMDLGKYIETH